MQQQTVRHIVATPCCCQRVSIVFIESCCKTTHPTRARVSTPPPQHPPSQQRCRATRCWRGAPW
jgi:hypothetical protein